MSNSLRPSGLCSPWNSPGQNTGVGSLSLLQGIFLTQWSNPGLPHCRQILYQLSYQGIPLRAIDFWKQTSSLIKSSNLFLKGHDHCKWWSSRGNSLYSWKGKPFCFIQVFNWLNGANLHCGGQSALLSLPFHMLISFKSHPHTNIQKMFAQLSWAPCGPITLTHKIMYHSYSCRPEDLSVPSDPHLYPTNPRIPHVNLKGQNCLGCFIGYLCHLIH